MVRSGSDWKIRAVSLSAPEVYNVLAQTWEVGGNFNYMSLSCEAREMLGRAWRAGKWKRERGD